MKLLTFLLSIFSVLAILPNATFAQTICTIEPGKGCGKIQLGSTKSEIKSFLGEGVQDSFTGSLEFANRGLVIKFEDSTDRVKTILFITNPKVWGNEKFSSFNGNLPNSLSLQTSPSQLMQSLANPSENNSFGEVTMIKYPGLEFGFRNNQLMYVEVSKSDSIASDQKTDDEEISTEEAKKQKEKLDSLKSNITFDSTPTPTPTPTSKSTPNPPPAPQKTGTISDCKIILSDGCRNYFFQTPIGEISNKLGIKPQYDRNTSMDIYRGDGIRLIVDPTTGRVSSLTIDEYNKLGWKPNNKIKWEEKYEKVEKEFGQGNAYNDGIHYPTFTVDFKFSKLYSVTFFGPKESKEEEIAYGNRRQTDIKAENEREREAEKAANTPEAIERKKQQMEVDYRELLDQLDAKLSEGNRIIESERMAIAAGGMFKDAVQKKIDRVTAAGDALIDSFGKKYQGMIPAWMIKGIQQKWRPVQ